MPQINTCWEVTDSLEGASFTGFRTLAPAHIANKLALVQRDLCEFKFHDCLTLGTSTYNFIFCL